MGVRLGLLAGGGDAPGLNAVFRAVVKTAIGDYGWEVLGAEDGFDGLLDGRVGVLTIESVCGILPKGGTILGTANRGNPFARKIEKDGRIVIYDASNDALQAISDLGLKALIVVGGDGTLRIAYDLYRMGAPIIGVPKTIDNDVPGTEVTFGFDTALGTATEAIDKLHTTAESHHRVMILEVMGRDAGWIALKAGIAGGADVILIPEIPFEYEKICQKVWERNRRGRRFSIIVVAEGAYPRGGQQVFCSTGDGVTVPRLGGIGEVIAEELSQRCGLETRVTVLGHLQRGGSPSPFDRILATRFGVGAVRLAAQDKFGYMAAIQKGEIVSVPLEEILQAPKRVDPEGELVQVARSLGICLG